MHGDQWHETTCQHCNAGCLYNNGCVADLSAFDVDEIECWKCGKVSLLNDEGEWEAAKEGDEFLATKSYPVPK